MVEQETPIYFGFTRDQWRKALALVQDRAAADEFVATLFALVDAGPSNAEKVAPHTLALFLFVDDDCRSRVRRLLADWPREVVAAVEEEARALQARGLRRQE